MQRKYLIVSVIVLVLFVLSACDTGAPSSEFKDPTVKLSQVQVQSYFDPPWAGWPGPVPTPTPPPAGTPAAQYVPFPGAIRVPLMLAFIWDVNNPNDQNVTLEKMQFTVEFEAAPAKPNEYFGLSTPITYEKQTIPPRATNQVRVVSIMDSAVVPGTLTVAYGQRLSALGITSTTPLIQNWWTKIGDFAFGIKATSGTADFRAASGGPVKIVTFEGKFPNK